MLRSIQKIFSLCFAEHLLNFKLNQRRDCQLEEFCISPHANLSIYNQPVEVGVCKSRLLNANSE